MILIICTILYSLQYHIPLDCPILYGCSTELIIVLLCYSSFKKTKHGDFVQKAGWFSVTVWTALNLLFFTWFSEPCTINSSIAIFELFVFISMFFQSQIKSYDISEDEYNEEDSFIVFKRPQNIIDYFFCFLYKPVSSVCVVSKGIKYGFKYGDKFNAYKFYKKDKHIFIKINISASEVHAIMSRKIGSKWLFSKNCCNSVQSLFPHDNFRFFFDKLPCFFMQTILTIRNNNK